MASIPRDQHHTIWGMWGWLSESAGISLEGSQHLVSFNSERHSDPREDAPTGIFPL